MTADRRPALVRWAVLIWERFPPAIHLPLVLAFGGGNLAVALLGTDVQPAFSRVTAILVVTLLFFFRLRLFDELKDHDTDLVEHPERPLPRGLVGKTEVRRVTGAGLVVEGLIAMALGWPAAIAWFMAACYSLFMYREFFCGDWLRPKMELYALTHTLIAGGLGLFIASACLQTAPWNLEGDVLIFALVNWSVFNVFEFARKTYGQDESDGRAETYSERLGPLGAVTLSLFWALLAVGLAGFFFLAPLAPGWIWPSRMIMMLPLFLVSGMYLIRPRRKFARVYRAVYSAFLFLFYAVLIAAFWTKGPAPW